MPVYYIRKIMFYGAIDMTAQTTRAKIAIGYRIGHLRVEEATSQHKNGYTIWRCRCDCGGEILLDTRTLQRGTITDCGCNTNVKPGQRDITSQRFGRLTAQYPLPARDASGSTVWHCICDCGGVTGVYRNRRTGRWCAQITFKRKTYYLGVYEKKDNAIRARKRGEGLHKNFIAWYYATHQLTEGRP